MKRICISKIVHGALLVSCVVVGAVHGKATIVRSVAQFDQLLAGTPTSVVIFFDKSQTPRGLETAVDRVSRVQRFKDSGLRFFIVDANRYDLADLFERYGIEDTAPHVQVFLCTRQMRNAFMDGCFDQEKLKEFVERFLGRALTTEINRKKIHKEFALAQSKRPYYAADYYNPFYMMPWDNYSPPSDWPDQGPQWVGIDVD